MGIGESAAICILAPFAPALLRLPGRDFLILRHLRELPLLISRMAEVYSQAQ